MYEGMNSMTGSMMTWTMGLGLLGWVLGIALLFVIVVLLVRLVGGTRDRNRPAGDERSGSTPAPD